MEANPRVLTLEGPHLDTIEGPDDQYLLVNTATGNYLKISRRAFGLLSRSVGLTIEEAVEARAGDGSAPRDALDAFFAKIARLGFVRGDTVTDAGSRLVEVWLHVTDRCNLTCRTCYFQSDKARGPDRSLSTDGFNRVIDVIAASRPHHVTVSGGEPLMRRDLFDLLQHLRDRGQAICVLTNGTLLTPASCTRLRGLVDRVVISLDGVRAETHERVRGKGTFAAVLRAIGWLHDAGITDVGIVPTVRRDNLGEMFALEDFAASLGVALQGRCLFTARGSGASCRGEYEVSVAEVIRESVVEMKRRIESPGAWRAPVVPSGNTLMDLSQPRVQHCAAGRRKLSIDVDGTVYPCQMLHAPRFRLGHVFECEDLNAIVAGEPAHAVAGYTSARVETIKACGTCDVRHFCGGGCVASNLAEGRSLDQCPSYCPAVQRMYRAFVWLWRADRTVQENYHYIAESLCNQDWTAPA